MSTLKPQDIAVLLKIVATRERWTIAALAHEISLSPSEVHAALGRAEQARLFDQKRRAVKTHALENLMEFGLEHVFFPVKGEVTRGIPTSTSAPPLVFKHFDEAELPPVWPHPMGLKRGYSFEPLYKHAAEAAAADSEFYELLALADALREGGPRVKTIAIKELKDRFAAYEKYIEGQQWRKDAT